MNMFRIVLKICAFQEGLSIPTSFAVLAMAFFFIKTNFNWRSLVGRYVLAKSGHAQFLYV